MFDPINPSHYIETYKGLEVIQLTEQMNFNRGNVVKYVARAGYKGAGNPAQEIEDLEKAQWYINREIERVRALRGEAYSCPECGSKDPLQHLFHPKVVEAPSGGLDTQRPDETT